MLKKIKTTLKNERGWTLLELTVGLFILVVVFFPLITAVFMYKDRQHTLDVITETYLNQMLVHGGMSPTEKTELVDELKKRGFDENNLDIIIYPDNAKPGTYNGHLQGSIPDADLNYAKRGEIIKLIVVDKRRNRLTALKERYSDGTSVKSSYPTAYKLGMSEGL